MAESNNIQKPGVMDADLEKLKADAEKKMTRHRLDDYVAIILGCGAVIFLWLLQVAGVY